MKLQPILDLRLDPKTDRMKYLLTLIGIILVHVVFGQARSKTDTLQSGELVLKQEVVINTSADNVWKAFTEPDIGKSGLPLWLKWTSELMGQ